MMHNSSIRRVDFNISSNDTDVSLICSQYTLWGAVIEETDAAASSAPPPPESQTSTGQFWLKETAEQAFPVYRMHFGSKVWLTRL